jgi:hypothetical protein
VWRIGKPAVRECVAHQQITEFVVNARHWNGQAGKKRETNCDYQQKEKYAANHGLRRKRKNTAPNETRDAVDPTAENQLQRKENGSADERLIESANQRLQIGRVRTIQQEHAEDNTSERAGTKMIRA